MYTIKFTTETVLYTPTTICLTELHSKREHTNSTKYGMIRWHPQASQWPKLAYHQFWFTRVAELKWCSRQIVYNRSALGLHFPQCTIPGSALGTNARTPSCSQWSMALWLDKTKNGDPNGESACTWGALDHCPGDLSSIITACSCFLVNSCFVLRGAQGRQCPHTAFPPLSLMWTREAPTAGSCHWKRCPRRDRSPNGHSYTKGRITFQIVNYRIISLLPYQGYTITQRQIIECKCTITLVQGYNIEEWTLKVNNNP